MSNARNRHYCGYEPCVSGAIEFTRIYKDVPTIRFRCLFVLAISFHLRLSVEDFG